jgi:hypothetical protein
LLVLLAGTVLVTACATVRVTYSDAQAGGGGALAVEATLKLFWDLAELQLRDPSVVPRLLDMDPRGAAETLGELGVDFETYRRRLAEEAQVNPVVLFLTPDAEPALVADSHQLSLDVWPEGAPPALLVGPRVDVLVLYEAVPQAETPVTAWRGAKAGPQIASLLGIAALPAVQVPSSEPLARRLYRVTPAVWRGGAGASFEHTRCGLQEPEMHLVTKLTFAGGYTETLDQPLSDESWPPCPLSRDPDLRAATVTQQSRSAPTRPVVIASSYFQDPFPGPLLARWIEVR